MDEEWKKHESAPMPGWACATIGIGFVVFLVAALIGVRFAAGG